MEGRARARWAGRARFSGGGAVRVSSLTVVQNLIFRYLQNRSRIQVWLYEQVNMRIEGCIIGFDEYMNLVLDDAEEIHSKTKSRKQLGRIMLKGDNITLLQSVSN
nr:PREDICTED: small nuclear ribonucleoprotein E [Equus przewalskii]